ncbi:MAG: hybrid sensor histidine kinase/response regulator [Thermoleophilia bacterium]
MDAVTLGYSLLLVVRLVGVGVSIDLYLHYRRTRFLILLAGWFVYALTPLAALVSPDSEAGAFVGSYAAALGVYLLLEVVLAHFDKTDRRRLMAVPPVLALAFLVLRLAVGEGYEVAGPAIQMLLLGTGAVLVFANLRRCRELMGSSLAWLLVLFAVGLVHAFGYVFFYGDAATAAPLVASVALGLGGVVFFLHLEHDVAQRELQAGAARMDRLLASLGAIVLESDLNRIWLVQGQTERILGYAPHEWFAHPEGAFGFWRDHVYPADHEIAMAANERGIVSGLSHTDEYRMVAANGRPVWLRDYVTLEAQPDGRWVERSVMVDVSEQKEIAQALEESEAQLRALVDSSLDHIFMLDGRGVYVASNSRTEHVGLSPGENLVGRTLEEVYAPELAATYREAMERVLREAASVSLEHDLTTASGVLHHVDTLYPVLRDGAVWAVGGICHDSTERRRLERDLLHSQKMDAVGRLAGGVAHDFNNYLTAIMGYAELLAETFEPDDPRTADVAEIRVTGERAAALTGQLLAFSRRQTTQTLAVDLGDLVLRMERMIRRLVREDIAVSVRLRSELWPVMADASQIEQVLLNLVVNAAQAMPGGGSLSVTGENVELGELDLSTLPREARVGSFVRISVVDTGAGMDEETLAQAFEPFFTTRPVGAGTGLGLSTVYGIVSQHNGFLAVDSRMGLGTILDVYLPRYEGVVGSGEREEDGGAVAGTETILLAEDNSEVRALVRSVLRRAGYEVLTAIDGEQALHLGLEHEGHLDLLLSDLVMPGLRGEELWLRLREERPDLKALFMSGYPADDGVRAMIERGDIAFLPKPFSNRQLLRKVREVMVETHLP